MAQSNLAAHKMEVSLNVLCALMMIWVARHVDSVNIITEDHDRATERGMKL
jgi:hypothetical protein